MPDIHEGHRERVKRRFEESGLDSFSDHNILELLLFYVVPRRDTNEAAHRLMERFGSLSAVLDAPVQEISEVVGVGKNAAVYLRLFSQVARAYFNDKLKEGIVLDSSDRVGEYLIPKYVGIMHELVLLVCLDSKSKVLSCTAVMEGTINATQVSVRKIVETAVRNNAAAVILSHNHPSGLAIPSRDDIATTMKIQQALALISVTLVDHVIVADNDWVSLRDSSYL
ncbi:MAG: RadC family protein [Acetanaerobacterium sp.]